jgi:hypothetical protein
MEPRKADEKEPLAGSVYGPLLANSLTAEMARKGSIEQRAIAVVTTSGILTSLLVALATFVAGKSAEVPLGGAAKILLVTAVASFVGAAAVSLLANAPRDYRAYSPSDIDRMVEEWEYDGTDADYVVGEFAARRLKVAQKLNTQKARLLQGAVALEVLGVGLVGAAAIVVLINRS